MNRLFLIFILFIGCAPQWEDADLCWPDELTCTSETVIKECKDNKLNFYYDCAEVGKLCVETVDTGYMAYCE